jgi:16S rRNA (guanine527-N7)-methyltransferase
MAIESLVRQVESWGLSVSVAQEEVLLSYARELASYEKANVIGTTEIEDIILDHILDSLSCLIFTPFNRAESLIDVGSGGGLPGVPLKILHPQMDVTLLEATGKKTHFLRHIVEKLQLEGVSIVNDRAETVGRLPGHRGAYDVATVRAVAALDVIFEYCVPLVKVGGYVISMKGFLDDREVKAGEKAALALESEICEVVKVPFLPELPHKQRNLVILRKLADTPERYPRKNGVPRKTPLGAAERK